MITEESVLFCELLIDNGEIKMNYNYEKDIKKYTAYESFEGDKINYFIIGKIKFDLRNKSELIIVHEDKKNKTLYEDFLPLGYSFVELLNINTNIIFNTVNDIKKCESITDIKVLKNSIFICLHSIASLHPYLVFDYCRERDAASVEKTFSFYLDLLLMETVLNKDEMWAKFIFDFLKLIEKIKEIINIIEKYKRVADLCLNISRNDEWDEIPLYTRLYLAQKFYDCDINIHKITVTQEIDIRVKSKKIESVEKKSGVPDLKNLKEIYKDCVVSIEEETHLDDLNNVCYTSLINMVKTETYMKKCANCGKYFIPLKRSDTLYCDRPSPQDSAKTCKRYGSERQYQANLKNDEVENRYRQTYMKLQMLVKRNPTIESYQIKFDEYKTLSKQWKLDVKNGIKSKEEFLKWINTY